MPRISMLLVVTSLLWSRGAFADNPVPAAEEHLTELRFDEAKELATRTLANGNNKAQAVARLYMVLGQVQASMGEDSEAEAMFLNALSIDAEMTLPDGVSPKIGEPFATAKARLVGAKAIALSSQELADGLLVLTVESDPANLIGGASVSYELKGKKRSAKGQGRSTIEITIPAAASELRVTALDMQGNQLTGWQELARSKPTSSELTSSASPRATSSVAIYEHWEIYAGLAGAALVGGLYLGKTAEDFAAEAGDLPDGTEFSEAKKLEDKAESRALYANLSFVGAGLLGAAAFWMYSREPSTKRETEAATSAIVPILSPDRIGIGASLRF